MKQNIVPKLIWMMWLQGLDNAPKVVKECYQSWIQRNPGWEIRFLDGQSYTKYTQIDYLVGPDRQDLSRQHMADIIRIKLLAEYGGVWVDATCFCCRPLDDWIDSVTSSGFFCFMGHRKDTIMSNWFMAARQNSYMANELSRNAILYWQNNRFPKQINLRVYTALKYLLNHHPVTTRLWFSVPVRKWLQIRPYFWFQYMFFRLCRTDKKFRNLWNQTPKFSADPPHKIQHAGLLEPVSQDVRTAVDQNTDYLFKLNWKLHKLNPDCDGNTYPTGSNIEYLLKSLRSQA